MAYTSAALTTIGPGGGYAALAAADVPLLLGHNALRDATAATLQWRYEGGWASGTSVTLGATSRLWDGYTHLTSYQSANQLVSNLLMQWAAPVSFDTVAIINHNFGSQAGDVEVELEIANNNAFSSGLLTVASWTVSPGSTKRLVSCALENSESIASRFSGVPYARLVVTSATAFAPTIGELYLGCRRSLTRLPDEPWDPSAKHAEIRRTRSNSGTETRYIFARAQRVMDARFTTIDSSEADEFEGLYVDCNNGTRPFLWVDSPATNPQGAYLMGLDDDDWVAPYVGPFEREYSLRATEQGPNFVALEV